MEIQEGRRVQRSLITSFAASLLLVWSAFVSGCSPGADGPAIPEDALVIVGGLLFDGTGDTAVPNRGIVIQDDLLLQVDVAVDPAAHPPARLLELAEDDFILPGFFDLHAHYAVDFFGEGRVDDTTVYPALFLANGVTSTFPAGEVQPERMRELRLRIEEGEQVGPRLFNSGPYFGAWREGWDPETTAEDIRREVDRWVEMGAHGLKAKGIAPHHLEALIEAAHAHGRTVTGHLDSGFRNTVNPRDAILMGIDRVEHFVGGDAMPPDRPAYASLVEMRPGTPEHRRIVELFIDRGVHYDATVTAYGYFGEQDPEVFSYFEPEMEYLTPYTRAEVEERLPWEPREEFERIYWVKRDLIRVFYELGGGHLITLGTDHPSWGQYLSPFGVHREIHVLALSGIPAAAVLRIATLNGARALGVDDRLGTLEPGKLADLVILQGNPLEDIRNTRNVSLVVKGGVVHDARALLDSMKGRLGPEGPDQRHLW